MPRNRKFQLNVNFSVPICFKENPGKQLPGGIGHSATTVAECQTACLADPNCFAFDVAW